MLFFKKLELARMYSVSEGAVRNWVEAARQGKLELTLHEHKGKFYIANTAQNLAVIEKIVDERKKYANLSTRKTVTPKPKFYELYSRTQVLDIISNLDIHHEMPRHYGYFDDGAKYWDEYATRLASEQAPNMLSMTVDILSANTQYIDQLIDQYEHVNVVDLGPGNGLPVKDLLDHLQHSGKLQRYIAVDISPEMLNIAKQHINSWFGESIVFEGYIRDISQERFGDVLIGEAFEPHDKDTVNIILFLGGTIHNLRAPEEALRTIYASMNRQDLLFLSLKTDSEASRRYFDFRSGTGSMALPEQNKILVDLLNIEESFYETEAGYDEQARARYIRIRLNVALTIEFNVDGHKKRLHFDRDETLLVWRYWHDTTQEVLARLDDSGFRTLHASQKRGQELLLTVSEIDQRSSLCRR